MHAIACEATLARLYKGAVCWMTVASRLVRASCNMARAVSSMVRNDMCLVFAVATHIQRVRMCHLLSFSELGQASW